jgi:hypothetical protein
VGDAVLKKLLFEGIGGEIVVVFDHYRIVALGHDGIVPNGFHKLCGKLELAVFERVTGQRTKQLPGKLKLTAHLNIAAAGLVFLAYLIREFYGSWRPLPRFCAR